MTGTSKCQSLILPRSLRVSPEEHLFFVKCDELQLAIAVVTVDPNSAEKSFGPIRLCSAEKSKQLNERTGYSGSVFTDEYGRTIWHFKQF